jgi:hypothetical protein
MLTASQLARVRGAPIAERRYQYVGGIAVQALIDHIVESARTEANVTVNRKGKK